MTRREEVLRLIELKQEAIELLITLNEEKAQEYRAYAVKLLAKIKKQEADMATLKKELRELDAA